MPRQWVTVNGQPVVWETCQTFSGSWGYHRDEASWKSVDQLLRMLIEVVSKGGNLLLNVGPTGRGEFDERAMDRLNGIGRWMRQHGRAIYGCTAAPDEIPCPRDCRMTWNPEKKRLYLHLFAWPFRQLPLDGLAGRVEYAQLLNDASEIRLTEAPPHQAEVDGPAGGTVTLELPVQPPSVAIPVIELYLK
jgi:alpha-L-fucosidase